MNISNVCAAIAETGKTIPGITSVFARSPVKVDTYSLPCLVALSGPATYPDASAEGSFITEQREFRVQIVVSSEGQGSIETIEAQTEILLQAATARFLSAPTLGIPFVICQVVGDTGVIELIGFNAGYIGFELRLMVTETRIRSYLPGQ